MTSRIVCMTGCNDGFGQLADICLRSLRYYCQRHDLSLAFHPLAHPRRPVSWAKIPLIQQALRSGADFVFWVDADALIVDPSRSIREVIEPGKDCYLARLDDGHRIYPNGGVMLLRNSPWMSDFLQRVWDMEEYVEHKWWETAAITHLLSPESFADEGIPDGRTPIDQGPLKWLGGEWNSIPYVQGGRFTSRNSIINHYASIPRKYRLASMQRDFEQSPAGREASSATVTRLQRWRWLRRMRRHEARGE